MARCKAVLLDLDGVVYVGSQPVPGAPDAIARLHAAGIGIRFLTNTTRSPHRMVLEKLAHMGLKVAPDELLTPARAARTLIERAGLRPHLLVHPALCEDFESLPPVSMDAKEAVIVGDAGDCFSYQAMNEAFRALGRGASFLALANNRYFRDEDGELSLDAGPFVQALGFATQREAMVLGKPDPAFFRAALDSLNCPPADAVMIGDDAESDVEGAIRAGLGGILVRTGKYQPGVETRIAVAPTAVLDDLPTAVTWLLTER